MSSAFRCGPRQTRKFVLAALMAGLVPFVHSSPGIGKSSIIRSIAAEANLKLIDIRLSTHEPSDLTGLPRFENGRAVLSPFRDLFPLEGDELPIKRTYVVKRGEKLPDGHTATEDTKCIDRYDGWLIFFDEFNSAHKQVQAASYKVILDRMVGLAMLHPNVALACAGNLVTDKAIVTTLSTAMQSRLIHIEMECNFDEWMQDVALAEKYDPRIIAYLSANTGHLMDFRPDHDDKTFCCPRTWEFMNKFLGGGNPVTDDYAGLYAGTITSLVAVSFLQFTKVFDTMIKIEDVLANPMGVPVPQDVPTRWAITSTMLGHVTEHNFPQLVQYANRFDTSFRVLFMRGAIARAPQVRAIPAFASAVAPIASFFY